MAEESVGEMSTPRCNRGAALRGRVWLRALGPAGIERANQKLVCPPWRLLGTTGWCNATSALGLRFAWPSDMRLDGHGAASMGSRVCVMRTLAARLFLIHPSSKILGHQVVLRTPWAPSWVSYGKAEPGLRRSRLLDRKEGSALSE